MLHINVKETPSTIVEDGIHITVSSNYNVAITLEKKEIQHKNQYIDVAKHEIYKSVYGEIKDKLKSLEIHCVKAAEHTFDAHQIAKEFEEIFTLLQP